MLHFHSRKFSSKLTGFVIGIGLIIGFAANHSFASESEKPRTFARSFAGNFLAARTAQEDSDIEAAALYFAHALNRDPGNPYLLLQSMLLQLKGGNIDDASSFASELLEVAGDNGLAHTILGVRALKEGDYASAILQLRNIQSDDAIPKITTALISAWAEAGRQQPDAALASVDQLEGPEWYEGFRAYTGALIADHLGLEDEAYARAGAAYAEDQTTLRVVETFARLQARRGEMEKANAVINAFRQRAPNHPFIVKVASDIEAGNDVNLTPSVRHGAAEFLFMLGSILRNEDDNTISKIYLQLALYLDPQSDLARMSLVDIYKREENLNEAIEIVKSLAPSSVFYEGANIEAALNMAQLEQADEALLKLEAIEETTENLDQVNIAQGNLLRFEERFEEAKVYYNKIIARIETVERRHWSIFYFRGITNERTDNWVAAERDFRQALELNPDQPQVLNYLGYSLVDQNFKIEEALELIKAAILQRPDEGYIIDSLGWAYFKMGQYEQAVIELEKAVEKMASDALVHDHLGDAYWFAGRLPEARFQWRHAISLELAAEDMATIEAKLENGLEKVDISEEPIDLASLQSHVVGVHDTLWTIAQTYLGKGEAFPLILEVNRDRLPSRGPLKVGTELRIPATE